MVFKSSYRLGYEKGIVKPLSETKAIENGVI
jgi:hypothetical protein